VGSTTPSSFDVEIARGLVGATAVIYVGIAVSTCLYTHLTFRLLTCIRGALVGLIFTKTLRLSCLKDIGPVTLMSTDIDGIVSGLRLIHDIWGDVVELAIGLYLLYREIGAPFCLVLVPVIGQSSQATASSSLCLLCIFAKFCLIL
jgi:hypothetical protein